MGGDVCDPDNDNDHCSNGKELGADPMSGGDRDPLNPWDFFDAPTPALTAANGAGIRSGAVTLADVIAVLYYVGTSAANPTQANGSGVIYGSDWNLNGVQDGKEYDRAPSSDASKPWRSSAPNGSVSIADAIVMLNQVGANCT